MSHNFRFISSDVKKAAINEIKAFIEFSANKCKTRGFDYFGTDTAPEGFKALKEMTVNKLIPIANYGCDTSIYNCVDTNILFRFYHDVTHLELNEGFSKVGEYAVINQHLEELRAFGASSLAIEIFYFDTIGQVDYYFHHKEFIDNQAAFLDSCLQLGLVYALKVKH